MSLMSPALAGGFFTVAPLWLSGKQFPCECRRQKDAGSIPESGRSSVVGNGNSLQYSCLENSMYIEARLAIFHGISKSGT